MGDNMVCSTETIRFVKRNATFIYQRSELRECPISSEHCIIRVEYSTISKQQVDLIHNCSDQLVLILRNLMRLYYPIAVRYAGHVINVNIAVTTSQNSAQYLLKAWNVPVSDVLRHGEQRFELFFLVYITRMYSLHLVGT